MPLVLFCALLVSSVATWKVCVVRLLSASHIARSLLFYYVLIAIAMAVAIAVLVLQVGIKYGGKGDVDISGLEMELREPYKVYK